VASLSMGALLGTWRGEAPLLGAMKAMKRRPWGWASLLMGAQLGNLEWVHLPGTFERWMKGALWMKRLSL
jgi:hypothetical protein